MNNSIKTFLLFLLVALFSSCCTDVTKEMSSESNKGNILKTPTTIAINKSKVTARIEEILMNTTGNYVIKAFIIRVEEDPAYPSLAMEGKTYNLIPNFQLDDSKKIITDSEKNKKLKLLSNKKAGDKFQAVIFFENLNGWFIQEAVAD